MRRIDRITYGIQSESASQLASFIWSDITMNPLQVNNDGTTEWERKLEKTIQKWNDKMSEQCCEEKNNRIALRALYKRRGGKHVI